jgi:putative DNA methylase
VEGNRLTEAVRKKLIEVALPLDAINKQAAREKSIRHGHPSTLHLWWARRPLAACRAVLFAQLVDDPSSHPDKFPTEQAQEQERKRLFGIIENLVKWENSNNETVLVAARDEILKSCDGNPPAVLDPFCGGGSIPLEAQRLGLKAYASDLNPVAVLITKALIEIPPKFANQPPINPEAHVSDPLPHSLTWGRVREGVPASGKLLAGSYKGAQGLAEDVRYYGKWMRDEAERRIGYLYPKVKVTAEMATGRDDLKGLVGRELTVIAWLWARTVKCPNPACGAMMPLVRSFWLSTKKGREAWVEPIIDRRASRVVFRVHTNKAPEPGGTKLKGKSRCLTCGLNNVSDAILREQASNYGISRQLLAIVAEGSSGRVYLDASEDNGVGDIKPPETPGLLQNLPGNARWFSPPGYGLKRYVDLFTPRQLLELTTFSDLVGEARERVLKDARAAGMADDGKGIDEGGLGATAYADAVATYLAIAVDRVADRGSTICSWDSSPKMEALRNTFARQAIPMTWDFAEGNPFSDSSGNLESSFDWVAAVVERSAAIKGAIAKQLDATAAVSGAMTPVVATDPPYYDNIGYADLSDFFYVWLRRALGKTYPQLFSTLLVPKAQELVDCSVSFGTNCCSLLFRPPV